VACRRPAAVPGRGESPARRPVARDPALLQEIQQLACGLLGCLFWNEVTDWHRPAANVIGPLLPYRERIIVKLRDRTALAPEEEHGAGDRPVPAIRLVLLVVQGRGCAELLADGVHRIGVAEFVDVLAAYLGRESVLHLGPRVEHEVDQVSTGQDCRPPTSSGDKKREGLLMSLHGSKIGKRFKIAIIIAGVLVAVIVALIS